MKNKKCSYCSVEQPISEFWKSPTSSDGLQYACKTCQRKSNKKYKTLNKEKVKKDRRKNLLKSYGLSPEDYDRMFNEQSGVCKICKDPTAKHWRTDRLFVDHDHKTGKVRGLLCHDCNYALGGFKDNVLLLLEAVKYLEESK